MAEGPIWYLPCPSTSSLAVGKMWVAPKPQTRPSSRFGPSNVRRTESPMPLVRL
jgi:hypothetical protein